MNADASRTTAGWIRAFLEIAGLLVIFGFYLATVKSNSASISTLQTEYQTLAPLSAEQKAVNDQRYQEIERQLGEQNEKLDIILGQKAAMGAKQQ